MKWFIKSDYDPYYFFEPGNKYKPTDDFYHDFDIIENLDAGFYREYLGSFHKSTNTGHDEGMEVIWSRYDGSPESLEYMGKSKDEENFWEHKLYTRKKWLYAKDRIDKFDLKANILFESEKEKQQEYEKLIEKVYEDFDKKYGETN